VRTAGTNAGERDRARPSALRGDNALVVSWVVPGRRSAAVAAALAAVVAVCAFFLLRDHAQPATIVVDDFESGELSDWQVVENGAGAWSVASGPASGFRARFGVPAPPGKFAILTDLDGPGTRILYRDLTLDGRFVLHLTTFYATLPGAEFSSPRTLAHQGAEANQQFRIDLVRPSAPIDSVARRDVLVNVFRTAPGSSGLHHPFEVKVDVSRLAGRAVRLRIAATENRAPLLAGVDDIRFVRTGSDSDARIELLHTPKPSSAIALLLHRSEADAVAALAARAEERAGAGEFAGAVLVARHGRVLLQRAWGPADRKSGTPNTVRTKFRLGSMNKMFTAVATLQLVEAGKLALSDPIRKHLPDYPNRELASKVTVRHLLTHTGGTGDIFGPDYDQNRLKLRDHGDYVDLYGSRPLAFEPGSRWEYSNYGFILLGALIEAASGMSYYDYVREHVFRPAGMTSTDSLPESEDVPGRAVGYMGPSGSRVPNTDTLPWRGMSAGGGYSTVGDLLRFAQALSSGKLISKAMVAKATSPQRQGYGFGFGAGRRPSPYYGHSGGAPGMNGELRIFPRLGYVVVALSNLDPPAASELVTVFVDRMPTE
jgi:D-alanyl-D-alanine carboxypeptidase